MDVVRVSRDGRELPALLRAAVSRRPGPDVDDATSTSRPGATRRVLGIVGAPGSGKSTLAAALAALVDHAAVVPMDGFHLADVELRRRGLLERKGAPETFDGWGYAALLARLRRPAPGELVMAPAFERDLEQPLAGAIPVLPAVTTVVTEGNYLLLDSPEWAAARAQLDQVWFVTTEERVRVDRLVARHVEFGKSPEAARAWVESVDQPNARLVEAGAERADRRLDLTHWRPGG